MDFDTHGLGLKPVEDLPSFDASLKAFPINRDADPRDIGYWYPDLPDDLPIYDADAQLPPGSRLAEEPWFDRKDPLLRNLPRFHPEVDEDLLYRCLPVSRNRFYALVDRDLHPQLSSIPWRIYWDDSGGTCRRYVRSGNSKTGTIYLHREVIRLHLEQCASYRQTKCQQLGVKPDLPVEILVPLLLQQGLVHHRNHNTEDNRLANLDLVAEVDNRRQSLARPSVTGFRGVALAAGQRYRARVKKHLRNGVVKSREVGIFNQADIAALARCLFLLINWKNWWVKGDFTPTAHEEQLWRDVVNLIHHGSATHFGWHENALPQPVILLLVKARTRLQKGTIAKIEWRG